MQNPEYISSVTKIREWLTDKIDQMKVDNVIKEKANRLRCTREKGRYLNMNSFQSDFACIASSVNFKRAGNAVL